MGLQRVRHDWATELNWTERIEDQPNHRIPLSQSLIQSQVLILLNSMKAERGEEATEEKFETSRGWSMRFKERSHLHLRNKSASEAADVETAAYSSAGLDKIIHEGGYINQQIVSVGK